ncbi:hypothetical protein TNCV_3461821 [Trichonephila clavipes]|nr:hypothetical protein TNCV_3461821 [Trichonephila clavipes]
MTFSEDFCNLAILRKGIGVLRGVWRLLEVLGPYLKLSQSFGVRTVKRKVAECMRGPFAAKMYRCVGGGNLGCLWILSLVSALSVVAEYQYQESYLGFCEEDTRNRWRDGQVCPDVDKELWRLGPDGSGVFWRWTRDREKKEKKRERTRRSGERERTEGGGDRRRKETERESEARLEWRKGLSPEIGVKKTMNAGGVENGNMI